MPGVSEKDQVTELLRRLRMGDAGASNELIPIVYAELRRIAGSYLRRERGGHTLQPTALVNEAYLKMFEQTTPDFADRSHFMALASCVMRRVLVDHARTRNSIKRGGEEERVPLDGNVDVAVEDLRLELLDLDRALTAMAKKMPEGVEVVEMRYFRGDDCGGDSRGRGAVGACGAA
jgi:RNA polymerase sigma-70 factor (ECF subfamily)